MIRRRGEKIATTAHSNSSESLDLRTSPSPPRPISEFPSPHVSLSPDPPITLLTDFGNADYFVGAVKGVILSINPSAHIVDLTHEIPAHDIAAAAFTILATYKSFPEGTVHVAVVDPGVGSERLGIVVKAGGQFFVGPDNGIFSYIYEREPQFKMFELSNRKYFRKPVSQTFHGRDIFAPVAATLSTNSNPAVFGRKITSPVQLEPLAPTPGEFGLIARILHIDRFGNCVTNLTTEDLTPNRIASGVSLVVNRKRISFFRDYYAQPGPNRVKTFCIWGSAGFLEISVANGSAAKLLKADVGDEIRVELSDSGRTARNAPQARSRLRR